MGASNPRLLHRALSRRAHTPTFNGEDQLVPRTPASAPFTTIWAYVPTPAPAAPSGPAAIEISGTARNPAVALVGIAEWSNCHIGAGSRLLVPPPPPSHASSVTLLYLDLTKSDVPPTATTSGEEAGYSTLLGTPESGVAKLTRTPQAAPESPEDADQV